MQNEHFYSNSGNNNASPNSKDGEGTTRSGNSIKEKKENILLKKR